MTARGMVEKLSEFNRESHEKDQSAELRAGAHSRLLCDAQTSAGDCSAKSSEKDSGSGHAEDKKAEKSKDGKSANDKKDSGEEKESGEKKDSGDKKQPEVVDKPYAHLSVQMVCDCDPVAVQAGVEQILKRDEFSKWLDGVTEFNFRAKQPGGNNDEVTPVLLADHEEGGKIIFQAFEQHSAGGEGWSATHNWYVYDMQTKEAKEWNLAGDE